MPQDDPGYYDATAITVMPLGTGPGGARTDTDADLNERDEFTQAEEQMRQDGTFGMGDIPSIGKTQNNVYITTA